MKTDGRGKPFYARIRACNRIVESTHYATAAEAGDAFDRLTKTLRRGADTMTICQDCGHDLAIREHKIGCSNREPRFTYRARRTVQDPRFADGRYIGADAIDPRVESARATAHHCLAKPADT